MPLSMRASYNLFTLLSARDKLLDTVDPQTPSSSKYFLSRYECSKLPLAFIALNKGLPKVISIWMQITTVPVIAASGDNSISMF